MHIVHPQLKVLIGMHVELMSPATLADTTWGDEVRQLKTVTNERGNCVPHTIEYYAHADPPHHKLSILAILR